jgi:hypothetical protein
MAMSLLHECRSHSISYRTRGRMPNPGAVSTGGRAVEPRRRKLRFRLSILRHIRDRRKTTLSAQAASDSTLP